MEKTIEIKKLSLSEVHFVVNSILKVIFTKDPSTNEVMYLGLYDEVVRVYYEMVTALPDLKIHEMDIIEFFDVYCDGKYDEYIDALKNDRRIKYIENALDNIVQVLLRYHFGSSFANAATKLVNNLNTVVDQYADSIKDIKSEDIKTFFKSFTEFSSETTPEAITNIMLEKKNAAPKRKKTSQAENKENKTK